jgi:uncharacterized protein (TIGR02145 family)
LVLDTVYGNGNVGTAVVRFTNPGSGVFERGIVWSSSSNPTISSNRSVAGKGGFGFTHSFGWFPVESQYYVRAYARTLVGIFYSPERIFTIVPGLRCPGTPTVTDIEGNLYHTVQIGNQCWTQSNLRVTRLRTGFLMPTGFSNSTWESRTAVAYANYENDTSNVRRFGRLYNHYAVMDSRGLCPTGWHVPTDGEWSTLETYLGGSNIAGGPLKSTTTQPIPEGWNSPNTGAMNSSGFTALPGGLRGILGIYSGVGFVGYYWSSSFSGSDAWSRSMYSSASIISRSLNARHNGFSVRCLKD